MDNLITAAPHLVVFGAGYVGARVIEQALARGLQVTALTRNPEKACALSIAGADVILADLAASDWHERLPGGADLVLNCVSSGGGGPEAYWHSYVEGMKSVLGWAAQVPVGAIVYTSSTWFIPRVGASGSTSAPRSKTPVCKAIPWSRPRTACWARDCAALCCA